MRESKKRGRSSSDVAKQITAVNTILENLEQQLGLDLFSLFSLIRKHRGDNVPFIPLEILQDRTLAPLEAITVYLKENHKLSYSTIAKILNRDQRTIWATYNNARKKREK